MPVLVDNLEEFFTGFNQNLSGDDRLFINNPADTMERFMGAGISSFARGGRGGRNPSLYSSVNSNSVLGLASDGADYLSPWAGLGTKALGAGILSAVQTGNPLVGLLVGGVSALSGLPEAISKQRSINKRSRLIKQQQAKERQQLIRDQRQEKILQILEKYYTENKSAAPTPTTPGTPTTPTTPGAPDTPGTPQTLAQSITQNFITTDTTPTSAYFRSYSTNSSPMRQTDLSGFSLLMSPRNSARLRYQTLYNA